MPFLITLPALTITESTAHHPDFDADGIFDPECDNQSIKNYYLAEVGQYFILDVGFQAVFVSVDLRNTHNDGSYDRYP